MKRCLLLTILCLMTAMSAAPQDADFFDSLLRQAAEADSDTAKAKIYVQIASNVTDPDTLMKYNSLAMGIAMHYGDKWTLMACYDNLGWLQYYNLDVRKAIKSYTKCLQYATEINNKHFIGTANLCLGNAYFELGEISKMWDAYSKSLETFQEQNDTSNACIVIRTMGQAFTSLRMFRSAQEQYHKSLALSTENHDTAQMACDYHAIGETLLHQFDEGQSQIALQGIIAAKNYLKIAEQMMPPIENDYLTGERISNNISLANCYIKICKLQNDTKYIDSCRHYVNLFKQFNFSELESDILAAQTEADVLMLENKHAKALPLLEAALQKAVKETSEHNEMSINKRLAECYEGLGNKVKAYDHFKRYHDLNRKIINEAEIRRASDLMAKQEIKDVTDIFNKERVVSDERQHRLTLVMLTLAVIVALLVVIVALVLKAFREKRISNETLMGKNAILAQQKEEIATQNDALTEKNNEIARQRDLLATQKESLIHANNQMRDSITYAQRIQLSAISSQEEIDALFPENFVLYRPRDIVSGDFYRLDTIRGNRIIIVADCTGHGVPGALLSMMGISALKDIFSQMEMLGCDIDPAEILERLRIFIKKTLSRGNADSASATGDGMDMSICVVRPDGQTIDFAGANQSILHVHDGKSTRYKGDFMPIGNYVKESKFTMRTFTASCGDMLYLFTDGIQDQLGGPELSKFSLKRLTDLLELMSQLPAVQQMYEIEKKVELWMGNNLQLDDITLLGVRI